MTISMWSSSRNCWSGWEDEQSLERALFGHTVKTPCSNAYLTRVSGERITKYLQTIESAQRRAATATSSRERAVQLGIVDEARAHLRELMPFMTKEQKRRAEKDSPF